MMTRSKRGLLLVAGLTLLLGSVGCAVGRPWGLAPLAGINLDAEELFVGADAWLPLTRDPGTGELFLAPGFQWYPFLGEEVGGVNLDASLWGLGTDLAWAFPGRSFAPYVRGGLALQRSTTDLNSQGSESDTNIYFNLAAGGFFGGVENGNRPFGQLGVLLGNGSPLYLSAGYRFLFGGTP